MWLDGSIIVLFVGLGGIGSCPIFSVDIFRLPSFGGSWRTAAHAYAYYSHKENVFGEWVFGCQRAVLFAHSTATTQGNYFINFFIAFNAAFTEHWTA